MSERIAGYNYKVPTRESFLEALTKVLGEEEAGAAWHAACEVACLNPRLESPATSDLAAVARALTQMGGLKSVVGNSMYVRLLTYQTLARRNPAPTEGGSHE